MFNEDILIDRNALDEECSMAPAFFDYWQNQESDLKTDKENYESGLSLRIRQMTDEQRGVEFGISKGTEGAIDTIIKNDLELQRLTRQYRQAESSRKSYEKKMQMLETLAKLHGQGYFSKIEGKPELRTMMAKKAREEIEKAIKERLKKDNKPARPKRS